MIEEAGIADSGRVGVDIAVPELGAIETADFGDIDTAALEVAVIDVVAFEGDEIGIGDTEIDTAVESAEIDTAVPEVGTHNIVVVVVEVLGTEASDTAVHEDEAIGTAPVVDIAFANTDYQFRSVGVASVPDLA